MSSIFSKIQKRKPTKSKFNLGHEVKLSCNMGELVPILVKEALPGDIFSNKSEILMRFAPLLAPVMHRVNVYTHFFFVPNRLLWNEWEQFIAGDNDEIVHPHLSMDKMVENGQLGDYMGLPTGVPYGGEQINALPFRAYNLIYNEYYRDQNLSNEAHFSKESGRERYSDYMNVQRRAWEKDYFTSALPWSQKGGDVHISMGDSAPVIPTSDESYPTFNEFNDYGRADVETESSVFGRYLKTTNDQNPLYWKSTGLETDLKDVKGATINSLRWSVKLQQWLEIKARAGSRYVEQLFAHFGVRSQDARLQRPEYLGGGRNPVIVSDVPQTSQSTKDSAQATLAGNAMAYQDSNFFKYRCQEHGIIIGIMSVLPRTCYQQGIDKMYLRKDTFDYAFPTFAQLGEQPILNKELFFDGKKSDEVFGYTPRYAEYKYSNSRVCGDFRNSLNFWHLGRIFDERPTLSNNFIQCNHENLSRIFAVENAKDAKLWVQIYNDTRAVRCLPYYGTPTL